MADPLFSLVVATVGRSDEVAALFASLAAQTEPSFEVVLVDQNGDARLDPIVAAHAFPITHLRIPRANSSAARNAGLAACRGALVAFPDDDCAYLPDTLARVRALFDADPALGVVSGAAQSPKGGLGSGRWAPARAPIGRHNAFTTIICFAIFLRRAALDATGGFDETLGVGARFGSCEENDLVIRAIEAGHQALYDPTLRVIHPDKRLTETARDRAFAYGTGLGRVLRKHRFGLLTLGTFLLRPLGGALLATLRRDPLAATYYWATLHGRWTGYRA